MLDGQENCQNMKSEPGTANESQGPLMISNETQGPLMIS